MFPWIWSECPSCLPTVKSFIYGFLLCEALLLGRHAEDRLVGPNGDLYCDVIWRVGLPHCVAEGEQHQREPDEGDDPKESTATHTVLDDLPLALSTPLGVLDLRPPLTLPR